MIASVQCRGDAHTIERQFEGTATIESHQIFCRRSSRGLIPAEILWRWYGAVVGNHGDTYSRRYGKHTHDDPATIRRPHRYRLRRSKVRRYIALGSVYPSINVIGRKAIQIPDDPIVRDRKRQLTMRQ